MIEPAAKCNLQCTLCTTPHKYMTRKQGIMDWDTYQKLLNDVKDFALIFYYNFAGEPFLNSDLFKMVHEAAKHDIITFIDTNATLLTEKRIDQVLDSGLTILVVNIDYSSKEKFEAFRKGANFESTMAGLKHLCEIKKKRNQFFPLIIAELIVSRQNEDKLDEINEFAMNQIGVDGVFYKSLCFPLHSKGFRESDEVQELITKYLPLKSSITRYTLKNDHLALKHPKETCEWSQKALILWDGRVAACCYDYNGQYTFGNINNKSFLEIWNSDKYRYYREKLIKNKKLPKLCRFCSIM